MQQHEIELRNARAILHRQAFAQLYDLLDPLNTTLQFVAHGSWPCHTKLGMRTAILLQQIKRLTQLRLQVGRPGRAHPGGAFAMLSQQFTAGLQLSAELGTLRQSTESPGFACSLLQSLGEDAQR